MVHQLALPTDPNVGSNGAGFLAQMYRLVKGTAALIRNAGRPAYKIHREGSVVQTDHRAKSCRLATPLSDQKEGDLALDAQVQLWIERTHRTLMLQRSASYFKECWEYDCNLRRLTDQL